MKTRTTMLVKGLIAIAIVQSLVLVARGEPAAPPRASDLSAVLAMDAKGDRQPLGAMAPAVVLVFDPECVHTHRVSLLWRNWLESDDAHVRVVALSASPPMAATAYASDAGWPVPVLTVRADEPSSQANALVARTPWAYALDARGRVVDDGPGSSVSRIASALRNLNHP